MCLERRCESGFEFFEMFSFSIVFDLVLRFVFSSVFVSINVVLDGFRMFSKYCLNV